MVIVANNTLVDSGIPLRGWHSRNHGALHTEQIFPYGGLIFPIIEEIRDLGLFWG